jgi:hypothetical protein
MRISRSILAGALVAAAVSGPGTPALAATTWQVVPSANSTAQDSLSSVTMVSPTEAWSAGSAYSVIAGTFQQRPLTEHHTGSAWQVVPSPTPTGATYAWLSGVRAISATNVWAVGTGYTSGSRISRVLVEHYDGSTWGIVAVAQPNLLASLSAVTASSASDAWAVGAAGPAGSASTQTLIELAS